MASVTAVLVLPASSAMAQSPQASVSPLGPAPANASLTRSRQRHAAASLPDGTILLIGGWEHGVGALGSMERYDPTTGAVSPAGELAQPRYRHTATTLPDGSVLVVGGMTDDTPALSSAELVTPAADPTARDTVVPVGELLAGRAGHIAVPVLGDGHVLIIGGTGQDGPPASAELYDPVTRSFTAVSSLAGDLTGAAAVPLGDGVDAKVLISGGATAAPVTVP